MPQWTTSDTRLENLIGDRHKLLRGGAKRALMASTLRILSSSSIALEKDWEAFELEDGGIS
jgi:hypothetical protein